MWKHCLWICCFYQTWDKWAASWQNQQNGMWAHRRLRSAWEYAQSDQSSLSAWRKLVSLATHWVHSIDWTDWVDAQADLSLRWVHTSLSWFCHVVAQMLNSSPFLSFWQYCCKGISQLTYSPSPNACGWGRNVNSLFYVSWSRLNLRLETSNQFEFT